LEIMGIKHSLGIKFGLHAMALFVNWLLFFSGVPMPCYIVKLYYSSEVAYDESWMWSALYVKCDKERKENKNLFWIEIGLYLLKP